MEWIGIVGSRDHKNPRMVADYVRTLGPDTVVVSGRGGIVDTTAEATAQRRNLATCIFPAQWNRHGNAAGPIRNGHIVDVLVAHAGRLVAFHDGKSRGTASTIRLARKVGLPVLVILPDGSTAAEPQRPGASQGEHDDNSTR